MIESERLRETEGGRDTVSKNEMKRDRGKEGYSEQERDEERQREGGIQ